MIPQLIAMHVHVAPAPCFSKAFPEIFVVFWKGSHEKVERDTRGPMMVFQALTD